MTILAHAEVYLDARGLRRGVRFPSIALLCAATLSGACGATIPDKPPEPPPAESVVATGDGAEVGGYFGEKGGRIKLGERGPSVTIPEDERRTGGVALGLRRDTGPALPAGAKAIGDAFRATSVFKPPSNVFVDVWSVELPQLPAPCTPTNLELAVQDAQQVGPADGTSSPTLAWHYQPARWEGPYVRAQLSTLSPYPLQFICARSAGGGT
jgi:hypothetical protein